MGPARPAPLAALLRPGRAAPDHRRPPDPPGECAPVTDTTAQAPEECIICPAPSAPGSDYCGERCRTADETGEQPPDWD